MSRWPAGARARLEQAALELFAEQGFAATTVPEITARAGLTTRTFFRHFADKREVLFAGDDDLPELVAGLLADAPAVASPLETVVHGLQNVMVPMFEGRKDYLRARRDVVDADPGLHERELRKLAALSGGIVEGLRRRGVQEPAASVAAGVAVTVFSVSLSRWLERDGGPGLIADVAETLGALKGLGAGDPETGVGSAPTSPPDRTRSV